MAGAAKVKLILGSHAHVPSGAPEKEFENIYADKLRPFVCGLYRHPEIQAVLHYSGVLLHWIERNHPEFFMLIEDMMSRKQAEILGGGFYEPILPLIPLQDRIGQIELMTTYLRKHFGKRPQGCWIPAFAWEQNLATSLAASGMNYTFLAEKQFVRAGLEGKNISFPCISEDQGKLITVFPVSQAIEAELAANEPLPVLDKIKKILDSESEKEKIITVFPDKPFVMEGESAEYGWNRFFEAVLGATAHLETALPGKFLKNNRGYKKVSFPDSSGLEEGYLPRSFVIEHPEAGGIYSKMIFTNVLITQLRGDKDRKKNAREELWKAQDSAHFMPAQAVLASAAHRYSFSKTAYQSLLSAERISREKGKFASSLVQYDFDLDGIEEFLFQDARINCYIQPMGAGIFELDYMPKTWNYLDTGSNPDGSRNIAFADILLPQGSEMPVKDFPQGTRLCFNEQYEAENGSKSKVLFRLKADNNLPFGAIAVEKCFSLKKDLLTVAYEIKNTGKTQTSFCFIPEINLSFAGESGGFARFSAIDRDKKEKPAAGEILKETEALKILDVKNEVQILFGSTNTFTSCLTHTLSGGLYRSTRIMPLFDLSLESEAKWTNEFSLRFLH